MYVRDTSAEYNRTPTDTPQAVAAFLTEAFPYLVDHPYEDGFIVTTTAGLAPRSAVVGGSGGAAAAAICTARVLREALLSGDPCFFFLHNHPSGNPGPSPQDIKFTRRLEEGARSVGLLFHDSIIVASGGVRSCIESETT